MSYISLIYLFIFIFFEMDNTLFDVIMTSFMFLRLNKSYLIFEWRERRGEVVGIPLFQTYP